MTQDPKTQENTNDGECLDPLGWIITMVGSWSWTECPVPLTRTSVYMALVENVAKAPSSKTGAGNERERAED